MSLEDQMNRLLERLGIPLRAVWLPSQDSKNHACIISEKGLLMVYDKEPDQAWASLIHEVVEWRLRPVLKVYREAVNSLIGLLEKIAYSEKETAVEAIIRDLLLWKELEQSSAPTNGKGERG